MKTRDDRIASGVSLAIHSLLLLLLIGLPVFGRKEGRQVLLVVETIPGYTPLGSGTGVAGDTRKISDTPANSNPLSAGIKLAMNEVAAAEDNSKAKPKVKTLKPPAASDLSKTYEKMKLGIDPRQGRRSEELSEGGMGNQIKAGTEDGIPGLSAAAGGRGYTPIDLSYPGGLPEESECTIIFTVNPRGEVVEVRLERTSGYLGLDEHILSRARQIAFAQLPSSVPQENQTVRLHVSFKYSGAAVSGPGAR
ncbi:MAG: TonB family protein [candidate division FCPU426 bacterium]